MDETLWVPVKGYEGLYEVSNAGQVRRLQGYWCRTTRVLKLDTSPNNQQRVKLWKNGGRRPYRVLVHRLVYEHFVGPIPPGLTINHIDGNRRNNTVANLEVATMKQQMRHAYDTGLQVPTQGEARGKCAKLTTEAVLDIRRRYAWRKVTAKTLAAEYGVSKACVWSVVHRTRWRHI